MELALLKEGDLYHLCEKVRDSNGVCGLNKHISADDPKAFQKAYPELEIYDVELKRIHNGEKK